MEDQLRKFQEMAKKMRERKDELLTKVETRQLPRSAPADANDTSKARNIPQAGNPPANASVEDMYALCVNMKLKYNRIIWRLMLPNKLFREDFHFLKCIIH